MPQWTKRLLYIFRRAADGLSYLWDDWTECYAVGIWIRKTFARPLDWVTDYPTIHREHGGHVTVASFYQNDGWRYYVQVRMTRMNDEPPDIDVDVRMIGQPDSVWPLLSPNPAEAASIARGLQDAERYCRK